MKNNRNKILPALIACTLCVTLLTACASGQAKDSASPADTGETSASVGSADPGETDTGAEAAASTSSVGPFSTQDVNGNDFTEEIFQDYDLTMVNIFTTWCSPCVQEMPDLEKLYQQMKNEGVGVVGVVLDVLDEKGEVVPDSLERAQLLAEQTGVTYPILLPDSTYMNGRLTGIEGFPETFFVDQDGNIVGETYSGSGDLEYWLSIVEQELSGLKGED